MRSRSLALAALLAAGLVAACGSGGTGSSHPGLRSPREIVLTAATLTQAQPFRMDATIDESFSGGGAASSALAGTSVTLNMHHDVESSARSSGTLGFTGAAGTPVTVNVIVYDGATYVSTDGGATYKSVPVGAATSQYSPTTVLQYLQTVGTVTDEGAAKAQNIDVERYHAQLDPSKATSIVKKAVAGAAPSLQPFVNAMQFTSGSIDVGIDHQGRLIAQTATFGLSVDLGAFDSSLQGQTAQVSETLNAHFYDYGAQIVVTKPANITGTLPA